LGADRSFVVRIDGSMARLKGVRGGVLTSRLIGMKAGDRISIGDLGFLLLEPDIRDHIENIERGPQIIIPKDASEIVWGLALSNGSRVLEGGAGSGGLTLFLLNSVSPEGKVYSYDVREDHLKMTASNVERAGLLGQWEGTVGDVTESVDRHDLDAVVLDIPEPERALTVAASSLKIGGRFCAYVPTTNQLERITLSLMREGFGSVEPLELIRRPYSIKEGATRPVTEMLSHTGFLVFARWMGSP
ncbi:MAG: methyltransferase domain-containing protein, partial [Candidatus Thermoplasmatota archaeon]|nr:methyltransferase domain-containing protein [Candidatus Thermoplasmatota archaeon]